MGRHNFLPIESIDNWTTNHCYILHVEFFCRFLYLRYSNDTKPKINLQLSKIDHCFKLSVVTSIQLDFFCLCDENV